MTDVKSSADVFFTHADSVNADPSARVIGSNDTSSLPSKVNELPLVNGVVP